MPDSIRTRLNSSKLMKVRSNQSEVSIVSSMWNFTLYTVFLEGKVITLLLEV